MTSANLNIVLTNALCCAARLAKEVAKLYLIGSKCADAELAKLKLLNDYIETLKCYKIDAVPAKFKLRVLTDNNPFTGASNPLRTYTLTIDDESHSLSGDGVTSKADLFSTLIGMFAVVQDFYFYSEATDEVTGYSYTTITTDCDVENINFTTSVTSSGDVINSFDIAMYQAGICTVENCLTDEEYQKLIEYVMSTCDICECQLNQSPDTGKVGGGGGMDPGRGA